MKQGMPTWSQTLFISLFGMAFIVLACLFSRMRENWGSSTLMVLILLILCGAGFLATVFLFYLRPQYGAKAFPFLLLFILGHVVVVTLLWRAGAFRR